MVFYKTTYCTITFHKAESLIYLKWLGQPDLEALLSVYEKGIDYAVANQVKYWIADNQLGVNFDLSMQRALSELSARRLKETNLKRFARIVPPDVFHELVSHKMLFTINQLTNIPIEFELFSSAETALAWATRQTVVQAIA